MQHTYFHKLGHVLWVLILTAVVVLAFYVSLGRLAVASLSAWESELLAALDRRVPFTVEARAVSGAWHSFSPEIVLSGLRLSLPGGDAPPLELAQGRLELDVFNSLRTRALQINRLALDELRLQARVTQDGRFTLEGFSGAGGDLQAWLQEFALNIEDLQLTNLTLALALPDGSERELALSLQFWKDGGRRQLRAELASSRGTRVLALGEGVGNPFRPDSFEGELFLDAAVADIEALQGAIVAEPPVNLTHGSLALQSWLAWERGQESFSGRVRASELLLESRDDDWQMPVEQLDFDASLVQRRGRWTLFASNVEMRKNGNRLQLPRVQLDAWGDSLRLRAQELSVAQLNLALVDLEQTPDKLEEAFRILQPGGELSRLEFSVSDYRAPGAEWKLLANFRELELDAWKGAPGTMGAAGFVALGQDGGHVIIDAQGMSLEFPMVYSEPLAWDDLHGTVYIDWDPDAVVLSSDTIRARGPEGEVTALFGLNIPLRPTEVGLEMDLMAGLGDTGADTRHKYLPFILNQNLLDWLREGVTDGVVREGAFLWRGSLRRGMTEARTVQLFFDIEGAALDYHPAWPAVREVDGLVLVDDTNVSVWAERAQLFDSEVRQLSAEASQAEPGVMWLQLDAQVQGDAGDGLRVVQQSPLNDITRGVFGDWQLQGELHSELDLLLNISNAGVPPQVDYRARLADAQLLISPGELSFENISGELGYSSGRGFSASGLRAQLWGEPLELAVSQQLAVGEAYDPARSPVRIGFDAALDMGELRDWLGLDLLSFAEGRAPVAVDVLVPPGEAPRVRLASRLQGVAMDLPSPWGKAAAEPLALDAGVELARGGALLDIGLGDDLALRLDVAGGGLRGGSMGFSWAAPRLQAGRFTIGGHIPVMDTGEWQAFLQQYLGVGLELAAAEAAGEARAGAALPSVRIRDLQVDTMQLWGQDVDDVVLDLEQRGDAWEVSLETDWLQGSMTTGTVSQVELDRLDLDGLPSTDFGGDGDWDLPDMDIVIRELSDGGQDLGELAFSLRSTAQGLQADSISGELAGLRFDSEQDNRLRWGGEGEGSTSLRASAGFRDFGDTLRLFGYERILETDRGEVQVDLDWPGGPTDFSLAIAEGTVTAGAVDGRFLEAPPGASGALRVVSILNLAEIVSRLSMTHMFESGIPFRQLDAGIALGDGELQVTGLEVLGASSRFQFSGRSDIEQRSMDGELVVTLPVASNLPWVAALAAGPAVAAGVFVVSKVFERQVDQLSSAVYEIGGSWDDPQVSFSRLFDDSGVQRIAVQSGQGEQAPQEPAGTSEDDPEAQEAPPEAMEAESAKPGPQPEETGSGVPGAPALSAPPSLGGFSPPAAAPAGI